MLQTQTGKALKKKKNVCTQRIAGETGRKRASEVSRSRNRGTDERPVG